jgi:hydroxyacylglutathione hydrolase
VANQPPHPSQITTIRSSDANCYLIGGQTGYVLIDSGYSTTRAALMENLARAGCTAGLLKLVILTHGDIDHAGNAAYLQRAYGVPIAMHPADVRLVEDGLEPNKTCRSIVLKVMLALAALSHRDVSMATFERFTPDILLGEDADLTPFGLDAQVLYLPGHTAGSIGILTAAGDLFAGDTLMNAPRRLILSGWAEDHGQLERSVERLMETHMRTVYPGHLKPFSMDVFRKRNPARRS